MTMSQDNNKNIITDSNRNTIHQILCEFGLDPSDYIFSSSEEQTSDHSSAFSKYSSQKQSSNSRPQSLITSGRPLTYVQQPPPPPPVIKRQASKTEDMSQGQYSSRRVPPPPPPSSVPQHDSNTNDPNLSAEHYLRQIDSFDNPPVKVLKPNTENLVYRKDIRIRYLQPPTPPPPAPIIIRERQLPPNPPESPLLIRERKPEARTPPPLTIRERPPTPPAPTEPYIVEKSLPAPPPQPRQIIIERLPSPPPKPRTVVFEKWLPYKKVKRPILLEKAPPLPPIQLTRNVIIEYEPSRVHTVRRVIEEGIFRVDPTQYMNHHAQDDGNVRIVDRIDDLPPPSEELERVLNDYITQSSSNIDQLTNVTRASNTPLNRQERVLSPGRNSSISSPVNAPLKPSQSKDSTHRESPLQ